MPRPRLRTSSSRFSPAGSSQELAKKYSDDPGSKDQGGELPMMPTSGLDPAPTLMPRWRSTPARPQVLFAFAVLAITSSVANRGEAARAHQDASPRCTTPSSPRSRARRLPALPQTYANQLVAEARKNGLDKTAQAHNLHVVTTDYIGRDGVIPSLPDSTALLTSAFTAAKGAAPQSATTGEGYAIFQVVDTKAAHAPDFASWKSHVLDDYRNQKTPELLNAELIKLADRAKVLNDLSKAAAEMKVPVKTSDFVGRDAQIPDIGSMSGAASVLFSLPKGGITGPLNEGPNGAVAQVVDKQEPTADDLAKNLPVVREKLLEQQRQEAFGLFAASLLQRYQQTGAVVYSHKQPAGLP